MNSKIIVFATIAVGLLVALFLGMAVGEGRKMHIALVFAVMVGAPLLLSLGKNYWYLIPASLLSGLPALPFGGRNIELAELCIALCFGIFVTRVAFKLDKIVFWRATHVPIYLFMTWVIFVFCLYPVGLAVFGSATMGARFYLKLLLAFMAFMIIASREITEKDCKWITLFILFGSLINASYNILSFFLFGAGDDIFAPGADADGSYTWHQNLSTPAMAIAFLIFARYKPGDIFAFRKPLLTIVYLFAILMALLSGKRMGLAAVFLAPALGCIVYRQYIYIFAGVILACILSVIVVLGHGQAFTLPIQVQRAISWLPADWDYELSSIERGRDPFREALRRFAMENINRDPIIGKGFAIQYSEIIAQIMVTRYRGGDDAQSAPYAIGRSWHNRWLGYAADFGIPLSVIQALIYLTVLFVSFKTQKLAPENSFLKTVILYILFYTVRDVMASHTSGHTAKDAFFCWWMYGLLFSVYATQTCFNKVPSRVNREHNFLLEKLSRT